MNLPALIGLIGIILSYTLINFKQVSQWIEAAYRWLITVHPVTTIWLVLILVLITWLFWLIGGGTF